MAQSHLSPASASASASETMFVDPVSVFVSPSSQGMLSPPHSLLDPQETTEWASDAKHDKPTTSRRKTKKSAEQSSPFDTSALFPREHTTRKTGDSDAEDDDDADDLKMDDDPSMQNLSAKERRQIRNKVSARNFRVRRKEYITHLESIVKQQSSSAASLARELATVREENARLVSQLEKFKISGPSESSAPSDSGPSTVASTQDRSSTPREQTANERIAEFTRKDVNPAEFSSWAEDWPLASADNYSDMPPLEASPADAMVNCRNPFLGWQGSPAQVFHLSLDQVSLDKPEALAKSYSKEDESWDLEIERVCNLLDNLVPQSE